MCTSSSSSSSPFVLAAMTMTVPCLSRRSLSPLFSLLSLTMICPLLLCRSISSWHVCSVNEVSLWKFTPHLSHLNLGWQRVCSFSTWSLACIKNWKSSPHSMHISTIGLKKSFIQPTSLIFEYAGFLFT